MKYTPILFALLFAGVHACQVPDKPASKLNLEGASETPAVFAPGFISTAMHERDLAISPGGDMILWSVATPDQQMRAIAMAAVDNGRWGAPEIVPFSGTHDDLEPAFAPDGNLLYFVSDRPLNARDSTSDYNIWSVALDSAGWGSPVALDTPINAEGNEYYPSVAANGNLYFTASRSDAKGQEDIYMSRMVNGQYTTPVSLDTSINSPLYEFNAFVAPDESYIIFGSFGRSDGLGGGDLYFSQMSASGAWQEAVHLGPRINSAKLDFCPFVDVVRNTLYFTSDRGASRDTALNYEDIARISGSAVNGLHNIYRVSADVLTSR